LFGEFLGDNCFNTFIINCSDGVKVRASRIILGKCSPVFKAMLQSVMVEKESSELTVGDIDSKTMQELINFMYTGRVEKIEAVAESLLYAAEKYQVLGLKPICINQIKKTLTAENVWDVLQLVDTFNAKLLFKECVGVACK
jgi:speckle-type POZ protein